MSLPLKGIVLSVAFTAAVSSSQLLADDYADGVAAFDNNDFAKAVHLFTKAIGQNQNNANAFLARGIAYESIGKPDYAIADYDIVIRLDPTYAQAFTARGAAWYTKKELDKAIADYGMAIRLDPTNPDSYVFRGDAWQDKGDLDKALANYDEAVRLDPKDSDTYVSRGEAWRDKGENGKALANYDAAIRLNPKSVDAHINRAWLRATCPIEKYRDGRKAVIDATKACDLTDWKDPDYLDTLAAAFAESGQFNKAVEWQKKAIKLVPDDEDFGTRLAFYQARKPYREEARKK